MQTPFPGMDPYLEHPALWLDVHHSLLVKISDAIAPFLAPRYYVGTNRTAYQMRANELVFWECSPIVQLSDTSIVSTELSNDSDRTIKPVVVEEIKLIYLEICEVRTHKQVTVIEILSTGNKNAPSGREKYIEKRAQLLGTSTNLVEIDLLRAGKPMPLQERESKSDYRILISRSHQRPNAQLAYFSVRNTIPQFPVPLQPGEDEPMVDLNTILHQIYDRGRFDLRLDYTQPPVPPLSDDDEAWASTLDYP